ncbi:MAG TPA: Mur ligase family protein, partial [Candidatus Baltobacteraceae bacterium]|nr:Mur ligase family protein [Candidatus Baltobacteraceae bacterium]
SAAGLRTGLHTKPNLHDATERARIDGVPIDRQRFAAVLDGMMPAIESTIAAGFGRPTYYETLLALALTYFAQERVDAAVVEVGLGGRLDGTNVLQPEVAAITSVGYDHTEVLGDTLDAIAREKAGIAKSGVPLVVADVPREALLAIEAGAAQAGARLVRVADWARVEPSDSVEAFDVVTARTRYRIRTPVAGAFQRINAATAITVLEQLQTPLRVAPDAVERGFAQLTIPGRMEIVAGTPLVVFDIAHNAEKAQHLVASLRERFGRTRVHYVVAVSESKDAAGIVAALAALPGTMTFTSFDTPGRKAIAPKRLAEAAASVGAFGRAIDDPVEALAAAMRGAAAADVVVVTGSTFVVGELRRRYAGHVAGIA